jgi:hypothetical protein
MSAADANEAAANPRTRLAKSAFGRVPINSFIGSLQFAGLRTLLGIAQDWTPDSGRASFSWEGRATPRWYMREFAMGTIRGVGNTFGQSHFSIASAHARKF